MEESKFIQIKCPRCSNKQITYGRATLWVKCKSCNKLLIKPKGGKAKAKGFVKKIISRSPCVLFWIFGYSKMRSFRRNF